MKKITTIVAAGFLGLALCLVIVPSSEARPILEVSGQGNQSTDYQHHHGGGSYGHGRGHGGHY